MKQLIGLLFLLLANDVLSQEDPKELRIECSAGYSPRKLIIGEVFHLNAGLSCSARKPGWFTNYAYHFTRNGAFTNYSYDFHTFSVGKFREWNKRHFYTSLGLNVGVYLAYDDPNSPYRWFNLGIATFPRAEIGWTNDRVILSFGIYFPIGFGYYDNPGIESFSGKDYWFKGLGALSPYLKIQF